MHQVVLDLRIESALQNTAKVYPIFAYAKVGIYSLKCKESQYILMEQIFSMV